MKEATCHPERKHVAKGLCKSCYQKEWVSRNPEANREKAKLYQRAYIARTTGKPFTGPRPRTGLGTTRELRSKVLDALGRICKHCGFTDERALQLDHKFGGGTEEKKRLQYRGVLVRALSFPDEYQILCANCNWIKRAEGREHL